MVKIDKKIIGFSLLYISTIALLLVFFTLRPDNKVAQPKQSAGENNREVREKLLLETEMLLSQLKQLQQLDRHYSALFVQSKFTPAMDSVDTEIAKQESIFSNIVDSFAGIKSNYSKENKVFVDGIDTFFKQSLESRRAIANIRYALAAGNFDLDSNQKKWLKLNSDLIAKEDKITGLEKMLSAGKNAAVSPEVTVANNAARENLQLKAALNEQQRKVSELTNANSSLNQNLKSLNAAYANLQKPAQQTPTKRNDAAENTVEELNSEIQLARISCNLARADVKQIISNSKQRKQLLSEAFNVLNSLSKSDNPVIQGKAKDKLAELYRITETIRD